MWVEEREEKERRTGEGEFTIAEPYTRPRASVLIKKYVKAGMRGTP
jgi:hypothetical protein